MPTTTQPTATQLVINRVLWEGKAGIYLARIEIVDCKEKASAAFDAIDIGSRRELIVDRFLIDRRDGASLRLQCPWMDDLQILQLAVKSS